MKQSAFAEFAVETPETEGEFVSLRELASTVWHGRAIIAAATVLALSSAAFVVARMPPLYTATTSVMFGIEKPQVMELREILADPEFTRDTLRNEAEVLRSTVLIGRVADALGLAEDPEFNPAPTLPPSVWRQRIAGMLRPVAPVAVPAPPEDAARRERQLVVARMLATLRLRPLEGTRVIEIDVTTGSPRTAAGIANGIAEQYIRDQLDARMETTQAAIVWLRERIEDSRGRVAAAEEAVAALRADLSEKAGQGIEITEQQLVALNAALSTARGVVAEREAQHRRLAAALESADDMAAVAEFRDSALARGLREEEAALTERLAALAPRHPSAAGLRAELSVVRARIAAEAKDIVGAVGVELEAARGQSESLAASVRSLETKALDQSRAQIRLRELEREAEAGRLLYETMLGRLAETSDQVQLQEPDARILSAAEVPLGPDSTRTRLIVALAAVLGLMAGVALVFLREHLRVSFRSPRQIERLTGYPVLAAIPRIGRRRQRDDLVTLLRQSPNSSLAEAVRNLRTSLLNRPQPPKVVLFTSSVPREGKSTLSLLTALTSRQMGRSTIVVDCDLRHPSTGRMLGAPTGQPGLLSLLYGSATLDEVLFAEPATGLHVLMSHPGERPDAANAADVLASGRFRSLVAELSERYDLVVLDAPPTLVVSDARILTPLADAVVYAVRWDGTPRGAVLDGLRELRSMDAPIAGIALTMLNEATASRYSLDGYVHYRGRYGDYYTA